MSDRPTSVTRLAVDCVASAVIAAVFLTITVPMLAVLPGEYDEGTFMLEARSVGRGLRPFVEFAHHQPPLHLYLLAWVGRVFGDSVAGYRMLPLLSTCGSGVLLFAFTRRFLGVVPALVAQAAFYFLPAQMHAVRAVAESPMLFFSMLGIVLLFTGGGRVATYAGGAAFVLGLLTNPTALCMVVAACLSLVVAGAWRRLFDLAVAGIVGAGLGLAWTVYVSDGEFVKILLAQLGRLGMQEVDGFAVFRDHTGFGELWKALGIVTSPQWTWYSLTTYYYSHETPVTLALLAVAGVGLPLWVWSGAGASRAVRAFAVFWPALFFAMNLRLLDLVWTKYFIPIPAIEGFLLAAVVWGLQRVVPTWVVAAGGLVLGGVLAKDYAAVLRSRSDPDYFVRAQAIVTQHASVVSFSPMLFVATGTEPGCGLGDPAYSYGWMGAWLLQGSERTRPLWISEERLVECLRAQPNTVVVTDFWFYIWTQPGPLRQYVRGEGRRQQVWFTPRDRERLPLMFRAG